MAVADAIPRTESSGLPKPVDAPAGLVVAADAATWQTSSGGGETTSYGCWSHPGPRVIELDKGNQDFAFSIERTVADERWVLMGVADGATQSTWAARGARHAAAAFIEAFDECATSLLPAVRDLSVDGDWLNRLAEAFHGSLRRRLSGDYHYLLSGKFIDPTWDEKLYRSRFLPVSQDKHTDTWFQTTLLAGVLGPVGALAIFLGDGYCRVDRLRAGMWESQEEEPQAQPAGLRIQRKHVTVTRIQVRDSSELAMLVATDGVSKSKPEALRRAAELAGVSRAELTGRSPLSNVRPKSSADCRIYLTELAQCEGAEEDNMSMAFASRQFR